MLTLWDLIAPRPRSKTAIPLAANMVCSTRTSPRATPMRDRYDLMARRMLREHAVRVRKWRSSMSGVAWQVTYRDGTVARLIESPRPRGPVSAAIFLHEIGHHAIGLGRFRPRCLEEYHAWMFALDQMDRWNLNITHGVRARVRESLQHAVDKARRRGLARVPGELAELLHGDGLIRFQSTPRVRP